MALMLLLVCTVVASIVIVAGSAVTGRLSQLREMEKSYYNVTSAAKLLSDEMDGSASDQPIQVVVTRSGNSDGTGWSMSIDGKTDSLNTSNATLFEILTYDLIFDSGAVGSSSTNLQDARTISSSQVEATIDTTVTPPRPNDVVFTEFEYDPFEVNPSSELATKFGTVDVTVKRNDDDTFSFTFTEEESNDNPSPAVYTVVANVQVGYPEYNNSDTEPSWTNTVTWGYLYTIAGDA